VRVYEMMALFRFLGSRLQSIRFKIRNLEAQEMSAAEIPTENLEMS
jgi:hypothetical protein